MIQIRRLRVVLATILILPLVSISSLSSAQAAAPWGSIAFDGNQYLSSTNMSAPGTGAFTYELWFNSTLETTTHQVVMNTRSNITSPQPRDGFDLIIGTDRSLGATYRSVGFFSSGAGSISPNRWYHFAIVRIGNSVYGYLDGVSIGSRALEVSDGLNFSSQRLTIGSSLNGSAKFTGYVSNFRYTKSALYNSNFTKPTDDFVAVTNTSILMNTKNDSTFMTDSVSNTTFTNNGAVTSSARNPFEVLLTQAEIDAQNAEEARRVRDAAIKAAREKINSALVNKQTITANDLIEADLPIKSVDSLDRKSVV
jgi:hypothetical protein